MSNSSSNSVIYSLAPWNLAVVPQPVFTDSSNPVPLKPEERATIHFHTMGIPLDFLVSREYPRNGLNIDLGPYSGPLSNEELSLLDSQGTRRRIMTFKIMWPGYTKRPFTRDISLISERGTPYTHAELAKCIALAYKEFFAENAGIPPDPGHGAWSFNSVPNPLALFRLVSVYNTVGQYFQADVRMVRQEYVN